jgi:class 3 adenylate cyclase/tetratricopeptide (TPR) repeat protein
MDFYTMLDQVIDLLRQRQRVSYRALKRQFQLDDDYLEDLKVELIRVQQLAVDQEEEMLVWTGDASPTAPPPATPVQISERVPLTYTPPYLAEKILTSRSALEGERKQVTVLFADLKGSMELLADRDPEEARQLLDPVLERMMSAVHRYEGTVNQIMGDGIMALFGAPLAHEDHAVRACYAALAMQEALRAYADQVRQTHQVEIQIRVGLNSGEVVVRAIGNDLHMDYSAIGQTTHLAARMEQLAMPGSILLTAETLRLAEEVVQTKPLGLTPIKGLAHPLEVFELVGAGPPRTRLQAFAARTLTRFVGRQAECEAMRQAHTLAGAGHGQLVAVMGEPGVGKTRLFYEFLCAPWTQGWLLLESQADSYGKAIPYHPVRALLKAYFQLEARDDAVRMREKVTGKLRTLDPALVPMLPAVLALLDVPVDDRTWQALDPPQRRQRTLDALKRLLLRESQVQPVLLLCENLHGIDTETQAFLESLVDSLPTARILCLVNYRPEYQHPWGNKTYYTQLRIDPLPPTSAVGLLQALLGDDLTLEPLKRTLIERTDGNPFFLEESVRTLVESQVLVGELGAYRLTQALVPMQVPATVQAVLAARIDRLPAEEKTLLQTAAVIGKDVPFALLQAITALSEETLRGALAHLQTAEFLYEASLFPELEYTFKHALTQEVAYGSLLYERRRTLHAGIVESIERLSPDRLAAQVERLASHALRGEVWHKAVTYCRQAGEKAMARSAYREAVGYFEQGLATLRHLPESRDTREQAIALLFDLRNALHPLGEFGRILDHLHAAEALAEILDDQRRLGWVSLYMAQYFFITGQYDRGVASSQRARAISTAIGDVALQISATLYLGVPCYALGDYRRAIDFLRQTKESLTGDQLYERFSLPYLPSVLSRAWLLYCLVEIGAFTEGVAIGEEGKHIAEVVDNPFSLVCAYYGIGLLALRRGGLHTAMAVLERGIGVCQARHVLLLFPWVAAALGMAYALSGRVTEAIPLLEQAVEQAATMHVIPGQALWIAELGEVYLLADRLDEAITQAQRALHLSRTHQEQGHEAWALRLLGEIHAHQEPAAVELAEAHYQQALALADELGMRPLVAHCHCGLGTLYATMGQREQARTALSTAIEMYRGMEMMFWLPQTEATLAQVKGR